MKKAGLIVASLIMAGTVAMAANPVYSVNGVGFVKLSLPSGFSMISVPFNKVGGQALSLGEAIPPTSVAEGTTVYIYTPGVGYAVYSATSGDWYDDAFNLVGNTPILRGEGFWITVPSATNITIAGEIPGAADATNSIPLVQNFQMVSFAYPTSTAITNSNLTPVEGDTIYDYNGGYSVYTFTSGAWYDDAFNLVNIVFQAGKGYWYQSANAKTWSQVKPYVWP